jgi:hypothetical protein
VFNPETALIPPDTDPTCDFCTFTTPQPDTEYNLLKRQGSVFKQIYKIQDTRYFIFQSWSPALSRIIIYKLKNIKYTYDL